MLVLFNAYNKRHVIYFIFLLLIKAVNNDF